ncbi:unnamed protein product [Mycena citricolor]|uniref:Uncharacterized protein n=1 Tax=Mycena citricolor TaxID=2018698 RepID=A0AAD2K6D4_9AGAR|nr:unnamed protein product [Mycena citricolor]
MSHRLASFKGPSTPNSSPVSPKTTKSPKARSNQNTNFPPPSPVPDSPSRAVESTYHRKIRSALYELRALSETWDDLAVVDGLKAARALVDGRTELDNALTAIPDGLPRSRLLGPKISQMELRLVELNVVLKKLARSLRISSATIGTYAGFVQRAIFRRMCATIDGLDALLIEAHRTKGAQWTTQEPLWVTWSVDRFVSTLPNVLIPYHRALHAYAALVDTLRNHALPFDEARKAIADWSEQTGLNDDGWTGTWEGLCAAEVGGWDIS